MKKRMILLLCAVGMIFTLTACQKEDGTQENAFGNSDFAEGENTEDIVSENEEDEYELYGADGFFDREYKENWTGYSIKTPSGYDQGDEGWGYEIYIPGEFCVHITQYCGDIEGNEAEKERIDMSQYQDSTDIFELLLPNVEWEQFATRGGISDYKVEVLFTKEINGLEMTKFQGEIVIPITEDYSETYPVIAYGIKGAKTPVLIFAYETDPESGKLEEWNEHLDEMVTTFVDAP